jgi:hypothetical protein
MHNGLIDLLKLPTQEWTRERLQPLSASEIRALCLIVGIPSSGGKDMCLERLLDLTALQRTLRPYWKSLETVPDPEQIQALADCYCKRDLVAMAKRAGIFYSTTKYGIAAGLIQWDRSCVRKGRQIVEEQRAIARARPIRQLRLDI